MPDMPQDYIIAMLFCALFLCGTPQRWNQRGKAELNLTLSLISYNALKFDQAKLTFYLLLLIIMIIMIMIMTMIMITISFFLCLFYHSSHSLHSSTILACQWIHVLYQEEHFWFRLQVFLSDGS